MTRGTTPTHTFRLPFSADIAEKIRIIYAQNDNVVLEKSESDCTINGDTISVALSQEDTFSFDTKSNVQIQLRVLTAGNNALASKILIASVAECLTEEVL